jgi:hypothetical protein
MFWGCRRGIPTLRPGGRGAQLFLVPDAFSSDLYLFLRHPFLLKMEILFVRQASKESIPSQAGGVAHGPARSSLRH